MCIQGDKHKPNSSGNECLEQNSTEEENKGFRLKWNTKGLKYESVEENETEAL